MKYGKIIDQLALYFRATAVLAVAFTLPVAAIADEVVIVNGDRITGQVVRQDAGALRLKTAYAGTLEIEWEQVQQLILDEPVTVILNDDRVLDIDQFFREGDQYVLHPVSQAPEIKVDYAQVKVIEPDPWELGQGHNFTGRVNIAIENEKGNSEKNEFDLDFSMNNRWRKNNLLVMGELEYDTTRGFTSTDNWSVMANLDHTFSRKWYYAGSVMLKSDKFADLKLRTMLGPGIGYRFYDSQALNLRIEAGPYYLSDDFYDQPDASFWGPAWFVDYDQMVWKNRLQLYHRQTGFQAVDNTDKLLWRSWTGVRVPLIAGLVGSVEYEIDYDSEPAVEAETTDQTFKLKLGYKW